MNYTQLFANVQTYLENQFPNVFLADGTSVSATTQINTFIQQAEQRIYNSVQFPSLRKNVTGNLTTNNKYLSTPSDFLSSYSLAVIDYSGNYSYLLNKDVNFMREAYPNALYKGLPKHYAIFGPRSDDVNELSFILGPTPDAAYNAELHYYYYPESIVTLGTSWVGENFPMCLLYGALCEANIFLKGEADLQQNYNNMFLENMSLLKNYADGRTRNDNYRLTEPRIKFQ